MTDFEKAKRKQEEFLIYEDVLQLYSELTSSYNDAIIETYFDIDSFEKLRKKRRVLQALIDGKTPQEIGKDYLAILEKLPQDDDIEVCIRGQKVCRKDFE